MMIDDVLPILSFGTYFPQVWIIPAKILPYPVYRECLTYHGEGYFECVLFSNFFFLADCRT